MLRYTTVYRLSNIPPTPAVSPIKLKEINRKKEKKKKTFRPRSSGT